MNAMEERILNAMETIVQLSTGSERETLYSMINFGMVVHRIRTGALMFSTISTSTQLLEQIEQVGCFGAIIHTGRTRASATKHLCIVHADDAERVARLQTFESLPFSERDVALGYILGYFYPISLTNAPRYNQSVQIQVTVEKDGMETSLRIFPQKVAAVLSIEQRQQLLDMASEVQHMALPLGYRIVSARPIIERDGEQEILRHAQSGGLVKRSLVKRSLVKRRRTRKRVGRRVRRSLKSKK